MQIFSKYFNKDQTKAIKMITKILQNVNFAEIFKDFFKNNPNKTKNRNKNTNSSFLSATYCLFIFIFTYLNIKHSHKWYIWSNVSLEVNHNSLRCTIEEIMLGYSRPRGHGFESLLWWQFFMHHSLVSKHLSLLFT